MGTRHLTVVVVDGEFKVAQYGQWDGYPSGQGSDILAFLYINDMDKFREAARATRFITDEESKAIDKKHGTEWKRYYPQLSRDVGSDILKMVYEGTTELYDSSDFANDSLFCEYAYVIDLDNNVLEVYEGFNHEKILEGRFLSKDSNDSEYEPVKLIKTYGLDDLPMEEEFLSDLEPAEEE